MDFICGYACRVFFLSHIMMFLVVCTVPRRKEKNKEEGEKDAAAAKERNWKRRTATIRLECVLSREGEREEAQFIALRLFLSHVDLLLVFVCVCVCVCVLAL